MRVPVPAAAGPDPPLCQNRCMWIAALVVAAVLITVSTMQLVAANPTSRLPWIGRAEHEPTSATMLRLAGLIIGLLGGLWLAPVDQRGWFGLGVLLLLVPTAFLQIRHNRRVSG